MDNLTHTLTAVALSQLGLGRRTRFATLVMVIGANLPDVDVVTGLSGSATYLKYHRGLTHSILGVTVLAAVLASIVYALGRKAPPRESAPPLDGRWLFGVAWVATASHLLLDLTNSYGVRVFLPFSGRWVALDILFIFDLVAWGLLAAGLGVPIILRLVSEEVGAKRPGFKRGAIFSLCSLVLLCGLRAFARQRTLTLLEAHRYALENPQRLGAFPSPLNPFAWTGVVETDSAFHVLSVNALDDDVEPESRRVFNKAGPSPPLQAAMKTRTAIIFSNFARFLWARVEETEDGFTVILRDLRFLSPTLQRHRFVVKIELDKDLSVRSESFSFRAEARKNAF